MFKLSCCYVYCDCKQHKGYKMTKKIMSLFTILVLLGAPTMIIADEALPNSTTEWLEDVIDPDDSSADGCYCG